MLRKKRRRMFSAGLAMAALMLPVALYIFSLKDKTLTVEISSHSRLVGNESSGDELAVSIDDSTVESLSLHALKFENAGYTPILPGDFDGPISVALDDGSTLYSTRVSSTQPDNLAVVSEIKDNMLVIEPLRLNPGDGIDIDLFTSSAAAPRINARIAGVAQMDRAMTGSDWATKRLLRSSLLFAFAAFYGVFGRFLIARRGFLSIMPVRITSLVFMAVCFLAMVEISRTVPGIQEESWLFVTGLFASMVLGTAWGVFLARNFSDAPKSI